MESFSCTKIHRWWGSLTSMSIGPSPSWSAADSAGKTMFWSCSQKVRFHDKRNHFIGRNLTVIPFSAGELMVKIINRGFRLAENPNSLEADSKSFKISNRKKPLWQPKTKVFVEQALREQEDPKSKFKFHLIEVRLIPETFKKIFKTHYITYGCTFINQKNLW